MNDPGAHSMPAPPDAYVALTAGLALLLEWLVPLAILPDTTLASPTLYLGLIIAAGGLWLEVAAARTLMKSGTGTKPNDRPAALAVDGVFLLTRNPFYCGIIVLLAGLSLAAGIDWGMLLLPLFWAALDRLVVPYEERRLEAAFGEAYRDYKAAAPRWLLR